MCVVASKSIRNNHEDYIKSVFSRTLVQIVVAPDGEPLLQSALPLARQLSEFKPDLIVAIGGGSVIDLAKLLWVVYEQPYLDLIISDSNRVRVSDLRSKANFVACPSTFGSGSENSSAAVFQIQKKSPKQFLLGTELLPDICVLDPTFCKGLPFEVAGAGILDAIAHAVEGVVSPFSNQLTYHHSVSCLNNFKDIAETFLADEDLLDKPETITRLLCSASLAGIVQNVATPGLGHSLSHATSIFGIRHGFGCGYFLPIAMKYNSFENDIRQKYENYSIACGFESLEQLILWITSFSNRVIGETNLGCLALEIVGGDGFDEMLNDPTAIANPSDIERDRLIDVLSAHNGS